jgi:DNA (cytosine-5)-methyltransferase 1
MSAANKRQSAKGLTAIDLFSGCGGLTLGLKQAGFTVLAGIECDERAATVYGLNHPEVDLKKRDIRKISARALRRELGLRRGSLRLMAGCPPCQGFSRLRTRNKKNSVRDDRNDLVEDFLRFVKEFRPQTVMMENVPGLLKHHRFGHFCQTLGSLGYRYISEVLDAADYRVPQRRRRLILLASRVKTPVLAKAVRKKVTVRSAFARISVATRRRDSLHNIPQNRSEKVRRLISAIPKNGGSRSDLPATMTLKCHKNFSGFRDVYGRMRWDDVSPTITSGCGNPSKGRFVHPSANRAVTLREAAILQGFPVRYRFVAEHGREAISLMIGNALPPPLIKAHASVLAEHVR